MIIPNLSLIKTLYHTIIDSIHNLFAYNHFNFSRRTMQRDPSFPRTPNSSDKIRIKHYASKSLSKSGINTPSPVIASKATFKEPKELGIIKEKVKRRIKE
jgi:hypothetical protein